MSVSETSDIPSIILPQSMNGPIDANGEPMITDEQYFGSKISALVRPDIIQTAHRQGIQIIVTVPEAVKRHHIDAMFSRDADICASRSFAGFDTSDQFSRTNGVFEQKMDLIESVESFAQFIYGKVIPNNAESLDLFDFLMGVEIFLTNRDPNWSFPLIQFSVQPNELNACRLLPKLHA